MYIPIIRRPIAIITPANAAPNAGDTITTMDRTIANMPTPMLNALNPPDTL